MQARFVTSQACLATSLADLDMVLQGPKSPISKRNPSTCCLISCETKEVVYHQTSRYETWWYIILSASQLIRQQVMGFLFDVRLLEPCKSMLTSAALLLWVPKMCRDALQHPRHAWQRSRPTSAYFATSQACLTTSLADLNMFFARSQKSHIEEKLPHLLSYKL